ncbi:hypothetical protein AB0L65_20270 [Nonomuraea sp. NPDC052116]|uniref:hypothetical protein n=1 Tax=Nonomuraea sp. NPDC052116 TaxID=3155665 RepID=UPI003446B117
MTQHLADQDYRYRSVSSHPALIFYRARSPRWQARATELHTRGKRWNQQKDTLDPRRLELVSFEYIPASSPSRRRWRRNGLAGSHIVSQGRPQLS